MALCPPLFPFSLSGLDDTRITSDLLYTLPRHTPYWPPNAVCPTSPPPRNTLTPTSQVAVFLADSVKSVSSLHRPSGSRVHYFLPTTPLLRGSLQLSPRCPMATQISPTLAPAHRHLSCFLCFLQVSCLLFMSLCVLVLFFCFPILSLSTRPRCPPSPQVIASGSTTSLRLVVI